MYVVDTQEAKGFEFMVDGKVYNIPRRESLPISKYREIRKRINEASNPEEEAIDAIFDLFDEYAPGVIGSMTFGEAVKLVKAYTSDEDLGESSPSSN